MNSEWQILTLGESLELLIDNRGKNPPYTNAGIPCISGMSVTTQGLDLTKARFIDEETWHEWMPQPMRTNDVVLTSEAPLGRPALVRTNEPIALAQRVFGLRGRNGVLDSRFLYYALFTRRVQADLLGRATGTTVVGIRQPSLKAVKIPAPDFANQQAIAEVLGALDDKIAANTKISQTSNYLASALFRSALSNAEFSNDTFADLAQVSGGGTPSTKNPDFWDGQVPWATPTDITGLAGPYLERTSRVISNAGLEACASVLYPEGSILMTSRATIGAFAIAQKPTAVNQGFIVVQPRDPELRYWLFHEMQSRVDEFVSLANGATFLELSRGNFKKFKVRQAPVAVMRKFNEQATTLHETARSALVENIALSETRDVLLPQLMSDKLRVKDAEAIVESMV